MAAHVRWQVGEIEKRGYGPSKLYGYGVPIVDVEGPRGSALPILKIAFASEEDAKWAKDALRAILAKVVFVDRT